MLMCPFTSNELISPFLDAYRGLVLVYPVYDFAQFHDPLYKLRCTFTDQFWVLKNRDEPINWKIIGHFLNNW